MPGGALWAVLVGLTVVLFALPWVREKARPAVAVVSLENCNGCGRCVADCPFSAIDLELRSDGKPFEREAVVRAARCVSCGICAGACPTATPFRRRTELVAGIELPDYSVEMLREATIAALRALSDPVRVLVYGCQAGPELDTLRSTGIATVSMPCVGMLPPAFIDLVLSRNLADGVFFTGCRDGDCYQRLGMAWTEQRLARQRDPRLRQRVPDERVHYFWGGLTQIDMLKKEIEAFRIRLQRLPAGSQRAAAAAAVAAREN
jgi:ferredoxin/coenzyme F420-reducing hydrogenase delta subunit